MGRTPQERILRARLAAHSLHAQGKTNTRAARAAYDARWTKQVDPEGLLDPEERGRRAEHARKAHYAEMAYRSARARSKRAAKASRSAEAA